MNFSEKGRIWKSKEFDNTKSFIKLSRNKLNPKDVELKEFTNNSVDVINQITLLENLEFKKTLSITDGANQFKRILTQGYDESILEYKSIEGTARCISHCIVKATTKKYVPFVYMSLDFYTKSEILYNNNIESESSIKLCNSSNNPNLASIEEQMANDYLIDRFNFIESNIVENSILFIDGPLFQGFKTNLNFKLVNTLLKKNVIPIFLVKNSLSDRITNTYKLGYNNDLHWAHSHLSANQRSAIVKYTSKDGRSKCSFYYKVYNNNSPLRVEMSEETLNLIKQSNPPFDFDSITNIIGYLYILNGSTSNNQIRPVRIAENFAQEAIKTTNIYNELKKSGLIATMNENRGYS